MMSASVAPTGTLHLELQTEADAAWPEDLAVSADEIAAAVLAFVPAYAGDASATILMSNDARVRTLNAEFRGKDAPTNILSFPGADAPLDVDEPNYLGDVILAEETVRREADEQSKPAGAHTTHLIVHGVLHLLGYDHELENDATDMEALEVRILERLGLPDPYGEELLSSH